MASYTEIDDRYDYYFLETLEPKETLEGSYGIERWNFYADPIGTDHYEIFGDLFKHNSCYWLLVRTNEETHAFYRIDTSEESKAESLAEVIFSYHCETYAP